MSLPQDLIDKLDAAEVKLQAALDLDRSHAQAVTASSQASKAEQDSQSAALAAHQEANAAAQTAIDAVRQHFGTGTTSSAPEVEP